MKMLWGPHFGKDKSTQRCRFYKFWKVAYSFIIREKGASSKVFEQSNWGFGFLKY